MFRKFAIIFTIFAVIGIVVPEATPVGVSTAYAQEKAKKKRKNLLELLFGGSLRKKRKNSAAKKFLSKRVKVSKKRRKKSNSGNASKVRRVSSGVKKGINKKAISGVTAVKQIVEKNEDAAKVLVVGDFMADGLSYGLGQVFSQNPAIEFVNRAHGLSGIVRNDVEDWPNKVSQLIDEVKPILVIMQIGMNDRQSMRLASGLVKKFTPEWNKNYEARIDAFLKNVRAKRLPLVWVGLPPVSKNNMNQDYLTFNELYQRKVKSFGGTYVDIWDGFTNIDGHYVRSGPNVDGRIVKLRGSDGINMTKSGQAKMAFYAEKSVKRLTGIGREALFSSIGSLPNISQHTAQYDPITSGETVVIALSGADADGGGVLEGAEGFITASDAAKSSSFELVAKGRASAPKAGRIDSNWGRASFDIGTTETPEPVLANLRGLDFKSYLDEPLQAPASLDENLKEGVSTAVVPLGAVNNDNAPKVVVKKKKKIAKKKRIVVIKKKQETRKPLFKWPLFKKQKTQ